MCASKSECSKWAKETIEIVERGYTLPSEGEKVVLALDHCARPVLYTPERLNMMVNSQALDQSQVLFPQLLSPKIFEEWDTKIYVRNESSLSACRMFSQSSPHSTCCLNFASAKNPGGGFANGARAQEESLARSSALYYSLTRACVQEYYLANRRTKDGLYTDHIIYSPSVPIFRDHTSGQLLDIHYSANFITMPAVNRGVAKKRASVDTVEDTVNAVMERRCDYVLAVAAENKQTNLVLGAWGCGVFQNDPSKVAQIFKSLLSHKYSRTFQAVNFAILAKSEQDRTFKAFTDVFNNE